MNNQLLNQTAPMLAPIILIKIDMNDIYWAIMDAAFIHKRFPRSYTSIFLLECMPVFTYSAPPFTEVNHG